MIRVLVVDDHAVVRSGLRRLLDAEADIETVGEAANADRAVFEATRKQARRRADGSGHAREGRHRGHARGAAGRARGERPRPLDAGRPAATSARRSRPVPAGTCSRRPPTPRSSRRSEPSSAGERYVHPALGAKLVAADAEERRRADQDPLSEREREVLGSWRSDTRTRRSPRSSSSRSGRPRRTGLTSCRSSACRTARSSFGTRCLRDFSSPSRRAGRRAVARGNVDPSQGSRCRRKREGG